MVKEVFFLKKSWLIKIIISGFILIIVVVFEVDVYCKLINCNKNVVG